MMQTYTSVLQDEGIDYRDIASVLTEMGYPMGHSTVRNVVIRVMQQICDELTQQCDVGLNPSQSTFDIASSAKFQEFIAEIMHLIELSRTSKQQHG